MGDTEKKNINMQFKTDNSFSDFILEWQQSQQAALAWNGMVVHNVFMLER